MSNVPAALLFKPVMKAIPNAMLQNPWLASLVSFALIVCILICMVACIPRPLPTTERFVAMPWWAPLGGLVGGVAVYAGLTLVGEVGAGPYISSN